jgi:SAM-dependent methyltransferase
MMGETSLGAGYFESLYRDNPDPWNFETSDYEDRKYQATVAALLRPLYPRAVEIGCSIGVLTARLAPHCRELVAVDLSPTAIAKARRTCSTFDNVRFDVGAAPRNLPEGPFDLIVLSEMLYYLNRQDLTALAAWCLKAAAGCADIILCHWLGPTNYPLGGAIASELFVEAMQPRLESHAILHEEIYRLERVRLGAEEI